MHLQAFFYFITYDHEKQLGGFIPGDIGHLAEVSRSDWGNPHIRGFADLTWTWDATAAQMDISGLRFHAPRN